MSQTKPYVDRDGYVHQFLPNLAPKKRATKYIVIREVATDGLRIVRVMADFTPQEEEGYTWGGPFKSKQSARKAIEEKSLGLRRQLYPETA